MTWFPVFVSLILRFRFGGLVFCLHTIIFGYTSRLPKIVVSFVTKIQDHWYYIWIQVLPWMAQSFPSANSLWTTSVCFKHNTEMLYILVSYCELCFVVVVSIIWNNPKIRICTIKQYMTSSMKISSTLYPSDKWSSKVIYLLQPIPVI